MEKTYKEDIELLDLIDENCYSSMHSRNNRNFGRKNRRIPFYEKLQEIQFDQSLSLKSMSFCNEQNNKISLKEEFK